MAESVFLFCVCEGERLRETKGERWGGERQVVNGLLTANCSLLKALKRPENRSDYRIKVMMAWFLSEPGGLSVSWDSTKKGNTKQDIKWQLLLISERSSVFSCLSFIFLSFNTRSLFPLFFSLFHPLFAQHWVFLWRGCWIPQQQQHPSS